MPADPFDPLQRLDPPDQWANITARTSDPSADTYGGDGDGGAGRRLRARALLAVAAALVLVVGGIALARSGDEDDELTAADGQGPSGGSVIPGECPFSLAPGPDIPVLMSGPLSVGSPVDTLARPATVGHGTVGSSGLDVEVAAGTLPTGPGEGEGWEGPDEGASVGWFDAPPVAVESQERRKLVWVLEGEHLGGAGEPCRDILVSVRVGLGRDRDDGGEGRPDDTATEVDPTTTMTTAPPLGTASSTTGGPPHSSASSVPETGPVRPGGTESTGPGSTESPQTTTPAPDDAGAGSDLGPPGEAEPTVLTERTEASVRPLIDAILDAVRFPDGDEEEAAPTTPVEGLSTAAPSTTIAPTVPVSPTSQATGPDDFGGTLPDGRRFTAAISDDYVCLSVEGQQAIPAGESFLGCLDRDAGPSTLGQLTVDGDGRTADGLLIQGSRPAATVETYVTDAEGKRVDAPMAVSPDGNWFAAYLPAAYLPDGLGLREEFPVVHLDADGNQIAVG